MELQLTSIENWVAIAQVIVAIFTMIYAYDVLVLHRRFRALGQVLVKYIIWFIFGIFITVGAFAIEGFGKAVLYVNIVETIGIFLIGIYFRKCMHEFFTKPMHVHK